MLYSLVYSTALLSACCVVDAQEYLLMESVFLTIPSVPLTPMPYKLSPNWSIPGVIMPPPCVSRELLLDDPFSHYISE